MEAVIGEEGGGGGGGARLHGLGLKSRAVVSRAWTGSALVNPLNFKDKGDDENSMLSSACCSASAKRC